MMPMADLHAAGKEPLPVVVMFQRPGFGMAALQYYFHCLMIFITPFEERATTGLDCPITSSAFSSTDSSGSVDPK